MAALLLTLAMSVFLLAGCAGRTAEDEGEPIRVYLWTRTCMKSTPPTFRPSSQTWTWNLWWETTIWISTNSSMKTVGCRM